MKRYEFDSDTWEYAECDDGDWVRWEDAEEERKLLGSHILTLEKNNACNHAAYCEACQRMGDEIERMREALAKIAKRLDVGIHLEAKMGEHGCKTIARLALEGK
jgi:hypothetical protein